MHAPRRTPSLLVTAALLAALSACGGSAEPESPDPTATCTGAQQRDLLYVQGRGRARKVHAARADGGSDVVLNRGLALDGEPVMTDSGCAVAFLADQGDTVGLWLAAADGSSRRRIYTAEQMGGGGIAFSPDGDEIVAIMGGDHLRRIDTEDGEGEPFDLAGDYEIAALSSSPGEDSIAFIGRPKGQGGPAALWIVDHLGGYAAQVGASLAPGADRLAWSPDNRKIAVSGSGGLQVVYLNDGTTTTVDPRPSGRPSWLPDSSAVVYVKATYRPASTGLSLPVGTIVAQPLNGDPTRTIFGPKPELADPQWALEGAFP